MSPQAMTLAKWLSAIIFWPSLYAIYALLGWKVALAIFGLMLGNELASQVQCIQRIQETKPYRMGS